MSQWVAPRTWPSGQQSSVVLESRRHMHGTMEREVNLWPTGSLSPPTGEGNGSAKTEEPLISCLRGSSPADSQQPLPEQGCT